MQTLTFLHRGPQVGIRAGITLAGWLGGSRNARAGIRDKQLATQSFPLCSFASADGVPFLMHDEELTRTTNVQAVFPERAALNSTSFNWTDLQQLDAGSWFLEVRMPLGSLVRDGCICG